MEVSATRRQRHHRGSIENLIPWACAHRRLIITVAPAQTLTDLEYQRMRAASLAVLERVGVATGGSNVQFAVHPGDGPHGHHRDETPRVALLGLGVEGHGLSHREGGGACLAVGYTRLTRS